MKKDLPDLDERLALIASLVRQGSRVADVGSDHGYLVAWLVAGGRCPGGVATDVNPMPLERTRRTVEEYGVERRVRLVLGDGLSGVREDEADDIILAGMGGDLMIHIMQQAGWRGREKRWLLQPMSRAGELRRWLCASGFAIEAEHAACAGRFCYTVITACCTGRAAACSDLFAAVGLLPDRDTPQAREYIRWQARLMLEKARGLERSRLRGEEAAACTKLAQDILATIGESLDDHSTGNLSGY